MQETPPNPAEAQDQEFDFIKLRGIDRTLRNLSCSLSKLEGGVRSFFQLDPHEASTGFNVARGDLQKFQKSISAARGALVKLFQTVDAMSLLERPSPMALPTSRNPKSPLWVAQHLVSGTTGCRNAIAKLLEYDMRLLKKGFSDPILGQKNLIRLATLSTVLPNFEFESPNDARESLKAMKSANPHPPTDSHDLIGRRTKPIDPTRAQALRNQFEEKREYFGSELAYDLAREICMQMEDHGQGFPFEELRELFGLTNHNLKKELEFLRLIVKPFNVTLTGSFAPRGRPLVAFETPDQHDPSTQSMK